MAVTQKISVAMGVPELRLAKAAAEEEGVSLSAYVTQAVRKRLEERERF
jgi:predicted HicB family RNase H-like nuclease